MYVFLNGKLVEEARAYLSIWERGFLFGDGIFETLRSYNGKLFLLTEHLERLFNSAKALNLKPGFSPEQIEQACHQLLEANQLRDARIRITLSRGRFGGRLELEENSSTFLITARAISPPGQEPENLKLVRVNFTLSPDYPLARHKTLSYLPYLYAYQQARNQKADEGLLFSSSGFILEASRANLFFIKEQKLKTPSLELPILPGITRAKVIEIAQSLGLEVEESFYQEKELLSADAVFLTNSVLPLAVVEQYQGKIFSHQESLALVKRIYSIYLKEAGC